MVMSEDVVVSLKGVSKCFRRYAHPIDRLKEAFLPGKPRSQEFWALRDIALEARRGRTLGIIGKNGSGKSTMLQIIAGTLTPTTGAVSVNGRVAALLELGSGFNPEFTGRQNVFFNGQILGLTQAEIAARFDQIAAFADIGDFIEQPVKTYSSGMFMRLAFSVATSIEPDILIIDEALAVGDVFFHAKCFRKIEELKRQGVSILFVSHATGAVQSLCDDAILINQGRIVCSGTPNVVTSEYYRLSRMEAEQLDESTLKTAIQTAKSHSQVKISYAQRLSTGKVTIQDIFVGTPEQEPRGMFEIGDTVRVRFSAEFHTTCYDVTAWFAIHDRYGKPLCAKHLWFDAPGPLAIVASGEVVEFSFDLQLSMCAGEYLGWIGVASQPSATDYESLDSLPDAFVINVVSARDTWGMVNLPGEITINRSTEPSALIV
jgi:lipopolysaccharide transport system ATP-binding protein